MTTRMNHETWRELLEEDLAWLEACTNNSLERAHIEEILRLLLDVAPADYEGMIAEARRTAERVAHLLKIDPDGKLQARWRSIHDDIDALERSPMGTQKHVAELKIKRDKIFEVLFP